MEKFNSSAKVIDGTLILTLPDAIRPVVWQMQLGQTKSSALEVREQNDAWVLLLKTPRADVMEIAPFDSKDKAVRALLTVSRAMEKAHGQIAPNSGTYPVPAIIPSCGRFSWLCNLLKGVLYAFLALIILIALLVGYLRLSQSNTDVGQATAPIQAEMPPVTAGEAPVGAAISADDFLNNQSDSQ